MLRYSGMLVQPPKPGGRIAPTLGAALAILNITSVTFADGTPIDVTVDRAKPPVAPSQLPDGFVIESRGPVQWVYPESTRHVVEDLQSKYRAQWTRITEDLGRSVDERVEVRIARGPQEMRRLAPAGLPPPEYASGVAYPQAGLVIVSLTAPSSWRRPALETLVAHELSHVAFYRAIEGQPVPRWFSEGVAINHSEESSLTRFRVLWEAVIRADLIPLKRLGKAFAIDPHNVSLAYAQSADFVAFLRSADANSARFHRLISHLAAGTAFEEAVSRAYLVPLADLELEWTQGLRRRLRTLPLVLGGSTPLALGALILVFGYLRRRRRDRITLTEWSQREAAFDSGASDPDPLNSGAHPSGFIVFSRPEPESRDPSIPTVHHDGRHHTLH